jgi:hypothetical protein
MSTSTHVDESTRFRAAQAAANLKERLLPMVLGQQRPAFSCPCDANHTGYAEAFDVVHPDVDVDGKVGLWRQWSVVMRERAHAMPSHCLSISDFVSKTELFAMFRQAFAGIDVPLELPVVQILSGQQLPSVFSRKRGFTGAELVVVVRSGQACSLRPADEGALWSDATIRVEQAADDDEPVLSVTIDSTFKHVDASLSEGSRRYLGGQSGADNLLTFVVAEGVQEKDVRVPLARLIEFDPATGEHTFELAEGVVCDSATERSCSE